MKNTHTHAHPQIPHTTYTSHSYTHSHLMNTLSHRQRPKWDPRPEARPRPHSKCKTQTKSVFSWARGSVPGQWFGLNSSCYFPNNRSLCPNSPSTVSCPATWNLITSGISFPPHWPCPGAGEQAARTASKRFRSSSIDPRHLPPERLGLWGFNVCQGLQLPRSTCPGLPPWVRSPWTCSINFLYAHIDTTAPYTPHTGVCTPMFLYILETHTAQYTCTLY